MSNKEKIIVALFTFAQEKEFHIQQTGTSYGDLLLFICEKGDKYAYVGANTVDPNIDLVIQNCKDYITRELKL